MYTRLLSGILGAALFAHTASAAEGVILKDRSIGYVMTLESKEVYNTPDGKQECPDGLNEGPREHFKALYPEAPGKKWKLTETQLAREAEICYASVAMVTDFDCWHPGHDAVTVQDVIKVLGGNVEMLVRQSEPEITALKEAIRITGDGFDRLLKFVKGPDFPTGGQLLASRSELERLIKALDVDKSIPLTVPMVVSGPVRMVLAWGPVWVLAVVVTVTDLMAADRTGRPSCRPSPHRPPPPSPVVIAD